MTAELRTQALVLAGNLGPPTVTQLLSDAKKIYDWLSGKDTVPSGPVMRGPTIGETVGVAGPPRQYTPGDQFGSGATPQYTGHGTGDI